MAALQNFNRNVEEAARDLGCTYWGALRRVTLRILLPIIAGTGLIVFAISMDEFVVTNFIAGTDPTLPPVIWSIMNRRGIPPDGQRGRLHPDGRTAHRGGRVHGTDASDRAAARYGHRKRRRRGGRRGETPVRIGVATAGVTGGGQMRVLRTVLGDVDPSEIGITLPHEHVLCDSSAWFSEPTDPEGCCSRTPSPRSRNLWWMRQHPNSNRFLL